jgi:hypothetical protein
MLEGFCLQKLPTEVEVKYPLSTQHSQLSTFHSDDPVDDGEMGANGTVYVDDGRYRALNRCLVSRSLSE